MCVRVHYRAFLYVLFRSCAISCDNVSSLLQSTVNIADTFLQPVSPGIKADNIYAVFHLFASEVPRFRIPGSRFRFRELPPAIKVVTDRYKVPGSGSITQRGTLTGAISGAWSCSNVPTTMSAEISQSQPISTSLFQHLNTVRTLKSPTPTKMREIRFPA